MSVFVDNLHDTVMNTVTVILDGFFCMVIVFELMSSVLIYIIYIYISQSWCQFMFRGSDARRTVLSPEE